MTSIAIYCKLTNCTAVLMVRWKEWYLETAVATVYPDALRIVCLHATVHRSIVHFVCDTITCIITNIFESRLVQNNAFRVSVFHFEPGVVHFSLHKHLKLQHLGQKLQDKASSSFSRSETPLSTSYLGRQNVNPSPTSSRLLHLALPLPLHPPPWITLRGALPR